MLQKGQSLFYERDRFKYTLEKTYTPDFIVEKTDGSVTYIESKGYLRSTDRTKILAVLRDNDIDLRICFMQDHKLSRGSRNRYSDWCDKHKITYAVGRIPEEWLS